MPHSIQRLQSTEIELFRQLMEVFSQTFEDSESYAAHPPTEDYISKFLQNDTHIVLVALDSQNNVIGGLTAYVLSKFEQNRREIFVYDLAVFPQFQRQGVATALFAQLKEIAKEVDAGVIFVQAEDIDTGAVELYRKLADSELQNVHHFDIEVYSKRA